jgi:serine protease inhibitor
MVDASPGVPASNALTARWVEAAGRRRGDFALSGAAVWPLLAALAAGAAGEARAELERAIGMPAEDAMRASSDVIATIDRAGGAHAAIGLWVRESFPLRADWAEALPANTQGRLHGPSDGDQAALDTWVKERTMGILDRLPTQIDDNTVLVLAACLAIRTRWATPFVTSNSPRPVPAGPWAGRMLHELWARFEDLDRITVLDTRVGALTIFDSLGEDDIDVHLVIGSEESNPGAILSEGIAALGGQRRWRGGGELLPGETAPGLIVEEEQRADPAPPLIEIQTVAFEVRTDHDLNDEADLFGLRTAADLRQRPFPGISDWPLTVQQARQSARATFGAVDFEAAAATSITLLGATSSRSPLRHTVRVIRVAFDRPFGFIAVDRASRLVLVAGWIENPVRHPYADLNRELRPGRGRVGYTTGLGPEGQEERS